MAGALQLFYVLAIGDALAMARQTMAEHVGDENNVHDFTHGANRFRRLSKVFCCANELGMGIAHRITTHTTTLDFVD